MRYLEEIKKLFSLPDARHSRIQVITELYKDKQTVRKNVSIMHVDIAMRYLTQSGYLSFERRGSEKRYYKLQQPSEKKKG